MNKPELEQSIEFILKNTSLKEAKDKERLKQTFTSFIAHETTENSEGEASFKAYDYDANVLFGGEKGYVFKWEDIVALSDIADTLLAKGPMLSPTQLAGVIKALLSVWQKLRKVRLELDENRFKVFLAVRRGNSDLPSIVKATGMEKEVIEKVIEDLQQLKYQQTVQVLEKTDDGKIITQF